MFSALTIAKQFINRAIAEGKPLTPMKLQKLIYLAHGLHLARHKTPLIREKIQAWSYGPVIPDVYGRFKRFGNNPITTPMPPGDWDEELDAQAQDSIHFAWDIAKDFNAIQLSNWTHVEGSPWFQSVSRNEGGLIDQEPIDNDVIKDYFTEIIRRDAGE
ncbi:Panacea domain-containing protein [Larkinella soli]|uniref:Panacea domain-containing protein n=1 Tax=Larkinella soli TaxID=1770527 RepID=UPI000FFB384E|nr:type II toxin-antitoxin system antitoxin SocA domain-containing protein [Larkinella soli]